MKLRPGLIALIFLCMVLSGCSFMTSFVIRNFSGEPAQVLFKTFTSAYNKDGKPRIGIANEIIKLNANGIQKLNNSSPLKDDGDGFYYFELPPRSSAGISALFDKYNLLSDQVIVSRNDQKILELESMSNAVEKFKYKGAGLFRSGGAVYYFDIK